MDMNAKQSSRKTEKVEDVEYSRQRVVFFVNGLFGASCLRGFVKSEYSRDYSLEAVVVCFSVNNEAFKDAKCLGVPVHVHESDVELVDFLKRIDPDFGFMAEYPKKLSRSVISCFREYIMNFHPSDLPKLRGGAPLEHTILQQLPIVLSCHKVDENFDCGDVILKSDPFVVEGLNLRLLYEVVSCILFRMMSRLLKKLHFKKIVFIPQDDSVSSSYKYSELERYMSIDCSRDDIESVERKMKASNPKHGNKVKFFNKDGKETEMIAYDSIVSRCVSNDSFAVPVGQILDENEVVSRIFCKGGEVLFFTKKRGENV